MPGGVIPPPSVIATWPSPNYVDPATRGPARFVLSIVLASITTLLVAARVYSRLFITRAPGIDDLLIVISLAVSIALTVLIIIGDKKYGIGHHVWDVPLPELIESRRNVSECEWFYIIATCSVKISILLFYRRLSTKFTGAIFIATWLGIAYNIAYLVSFFVLLAVVCLPAKAYWLQLDFAWATTHKFTCVDEHLSLPSSAATSVFGDLYATLLPCMLILKLHMPLRQKIALYSLFALGFLVVAAGIVRTYYIDYVINGTYDVTWYMWQFWIWNLVELYISIIPASAPALKPFFRHFLVKAITSQKGGSPTYVRNGKPQSYEAPRKFRSDASSPVRDNYDSDIEKIGVAVGGDGARQFELRTLPGGKVEPFQVYVRPQASIDLRSESQASSLYPNEPNDWTLPPTGPSDDSCPLRTYRAEIEALSLVPGPGRPAPVVAFATRSRSVTPSRHMGGGSLQRWSTPIVRYSSRSMVQPEKDQGQELGSVRVARLKAEDLKRASAGAVAAQWAARDRDDSDKEYMPSGSSSSDETLHLPKQRNVVSVA